MSVHILTDWHADDDKVFVATSRDDFCAVPWSEAIRERMDIITCTYCDQPAVVLDHYWPYGCTANLCKKHRGAPKEGWHKTKDKRAKAHYYVGFRSLCWRWHTEWYTFDKGNDVGARCHTCDRLAARRLAHAKQR